MELWLDWFGAQGIGAPRVTLIGVPVDEADSIAELARVQRLFPESTVQWWKPLGGQLRVAPDDAIRIGQDFGPVA
jgi:hypothetical protein